jgi:HAD superfamily hydrolase (TIGR01509 family)
MNRVSPKFIYFDLGNVLLTFNRHTACEQLAALTGVSADSVWGHLFDSGLQDRYEHGELTSEQIYEEFCRSSLGDSKDWPQYAAFHRANSDIFRLHVPIIGIVAHLHAAGYPLGILSNTCDEHWKHVANGRYTVLQRYFREVVLSFELRCAKPDVKIFLAAAERAGCDPGEIFFTDDRPENVAGARQAGIDAVDFLSPQQLAIDLRERGVRFNY